MGQYPNKRERASQNVETNGISCSRTTRGAAMLIADRRLIVSGPSGDTEVPVRLFKPEADDGMWVCRYEIDWPDRKWSSFAGGVDSVQALVLALYKIGIEIYTSSHHKSGSLKWFEKYQGYGFPLGGNVREMLIGDDKNL
jgi:hypothetical protein